jgi:long-chain acyl-CoA synthetase
MTPAATAANVAELLRRTARTWPRGRAVAHGEGACVDYATLARRVARLAASLRRAGLAPGERVALVSRNVPGYVEALFACWWAGLVAVPVNAKLHAKELAFVIEDSGARFAFVDDAWHAALSAAAAVGADALRDAVAFGSSAYAALAERDNELPLEPVAPRDAAWLFYTSGTTGRPKGVVITHGNLYAMTLAFLADVLPVSPGDAILHPAPLSHGSGLYVVPHVARGAANVVPESGGFDPGEIVALARAWSGAAFFAAPTMVKRLVESPAIERLAREDLKGVVYGGGPMYVADCKAAFAALGPRLAQIYGQGESPMTITAMDRTVVADAIARGDLHRIGSVGTAQLGIEVRIAGTDDAALPTGEVGEVLVRGATVMREYWGNAEATARTLANGWLHTGDLGALDADGFLTLKDRSKDLVISGGSNIYPREVEEALLSHPDVAEAAVFGHPHPAWGEEVVAFVVARVAIGDDDARRCLEAVLDAHCRGEIARFKRPRHYVFVDALPKNNAGKVLKTALRERFGSDRPS